MAGNVQGPEVPAIDGENFHTTKEGYLRAGPRRISTTVDKCDPDLVVDPPTELPIHDLYDLADQRGFVWLDKYEWIMLKDCTPTVFATFQAIEGEDQKWFGNYLYVSDIPGDEIRFRALKRSLESTGLIRIWFLDERLNDAERYTPDPVTWTPSQNHICSETTTTFKDLVTRFRRPVLLEYPECYELFGNWELEFLLDQTGVEEKAQMEMQIELSHIASTGELFIRAYDAQVNTEGHWISDPQVEGEFKTLIGPMRWPFADRQHLQDPNKIQYGICTQLNPTGIYEAVYEWEINVWQGLSSADDGDWNPTPGNQYYDARPRSGNDSNIRTEQNHLYNAIWMKGSTICQLFNAFGMYNKYFGPTGWDNTILCNQTSSGNIDYESDQFTPGNWGIGPNGTMNFIVEWKGKIGIPIAGWYTYYTAVNTGIYLQIGDQTVFELNLETAWDDPGAVRYEAIRSHQTGEYAGEPRGAKRAWFDAGQYDFVVQWWNTSPYYLFHLDLCPKPYLQIPPDAPSYWEKSEADWDAIFPDSCSGCGGDTYPDSGPTCCVGWDAIFAGNFVANRWHIRVGDGDIVDPPDPPDLECVIVDNMDPQVTNGGNGTWLTGTAVGGYYGTNYHHDGNNVTQKTMWFKFPFPISVSGDYDVYEWHSSNSYRANNVPIDIISAGAVTNTVYINQELNPSQWNLLGTWNFVTGEDAEVIIRNDGTYQGSGDGFVAADAIALCPSGTSPTVFSAGVEFHDPAIYSHTGYVYVVPPHQPGTINADCDVMPTEEIFTFKVSPTELLTEGPPDG